MFYHTDSRSSATSTLQYSANNLTNIIIWKFCFVVLSAVVAAVINDFEHIKLFYTTC